MAAERNSFWTELRDGASAIREVVVVLAIVLLLVSPGSIHGILQRAGVSSVAGVEFDVETVDQLNQDAFDASQEVSSVKEQLAALRVQLNDHAQRSRSPEVLAMAQTVTGLEDKLGHARETIDHAHHVAYDSVPDAVRPRLKAPKELFKPKEKAQLETSQIISVPTTLSR